MQPSVEGSRGVPAGAAVPADGQDKVQPSVESSRGVPAGADTQVRPQGSKRPGPHNGPDGLVKKCLKLCQILENVVDRLDHNSTSILQLQAHGRVDPRFRHDQHRRAMADNDRVRQAVSAIRSEIQQMDSTPETPQPTPETPETPPPGNCTQTAQNALQQVTAPRTAQRCTGNCMAGCGMCFPGLK